MMTTLRRLQKQKSWKGEILPDTLFSLQVRDHDDWYAVVTAKSSDPAEEPIIVITGPFPTQDDAREHNGKWLDLGHANGHLWLPDRATVPAGTRKAITADILRGWHSGQFENLRSWKGGADLQIDLKPKH
jgi:hypothetical protein